MKKILLLGTFLAVAIFTYNNFTPAVCLGSECADVVSTEQVASFSSPNFFRNSMEKGYYTLLDVREKSEWDAGHIEGAKHIPLGSLNADTTKDIPKDKPVYIYCRSGRRAESAEAMMKVLGFSQAKNIGGVIEWQENGGVLVK